MNFNIRQFWRFWWKFCPENSQQMKFVNRYDSDETSKERRKFSVVKMDIFNCELAMGWLQRVGSFKLWVSFAEYRLFYRALLQKRPMILRSLLIVATPYHSTVIKFYQVTVSNDSKADCEEFQQQKWKSSRASSPSIYQNEIPPTYYIKWQQSSL